MSPDLLPLVALPFCLLLSWEVALRRHIRHVLRSHLRRTGVGVDVSFDGLFPGPPVLSVLAPPDASAHARLQTEALVLRL